MRVDTTSASSPPRNGRGPAGDEWDGFVAAHAPDEAPGPCASARAVELGHAAAWGDVLRDGYGIETFRLVAREADGAWAGVVALAVVRQLSRRRTLVSLPYLDGAGVLARRDEAERALLDETASLARRLGVNAIELRQGASLRTLRPGAAPTAARVSMELALPADEDALWRGLPAKVRNQTRKARRQGVELAPDGADGIGEFYAVHRARMRDLGSPVHAERFFRAVARHFGCRMRAIVVRRRGTPVGALIAIRNGDAVHVPWASTLARENRHCPNNLVYWEALRWAVEQGARRFDFGRSEPGSGTHRFKQGWGARERPLAWTRLDARGRAIPLSLPGDSRVLAGLSRVWRHLPPGVCDLLGPRVRPHIAS